MMAKHVAIGVAIKSALRSKEYITVLNKHAESISYHEVFAINSYWSNQLIEKGEGYATLPTNTCNGIFSQAT